MLPFKFKTDQSSRFQNYIYLNIIFCTECDVLYHIILFIRSSIGVYSATLLLFLLLLCLRNWIAVSKFRLAIQNITCIIIIIMIDCICRGAKLCISYTVVSENMRKFNRSVSVLSIIYVHFTHFSRFSRKPKGILWLWRVLGWNHVRFSIERVHNNFKAGLLQP